MVMKDEDDTMIYVISDLHGYSLESIQDFLGKVGFCSDDTLYILGDVIDRGTDGVKLLRWMMLQRNVEFILGNHEEMLLKSGYLDELAEDSDSDSTYRKFNVYNTWVSNGGKITADDLCTTNKRVILCIMDYLMNVPLYKEITVGGKKFILTHSGLGGFKKDKSMEDYSSYDLLWTRPNMNTRYFDDAMVIFGHTPTVYMGDGQLGKILKTDTWINIDVGVAVGQEPAILRLDDLKEFYYKDYIGNN